MKKIFNSHAADSFAGKDKEEAAKALKKKIDNSLKGKVKVRVKFNEEGKKHKVPTWIFVPKKDLKTIKHRL